MTRPAPPRTPLLCIVCRTHLGWWPEDDPRCPSCRYLPTPEVSKP